MKWRLSIVVLLGLSSVDVASLAQRPPDGESPPTASPTPLADGCFSSAGIVRFRMIAGRVSLDPPRHRKGSESRDVDGVYESVRVTAERGIPSLHYVCHTPSQQLTLSVRDATELRIESWFPATEQRGVLEQPEYDEIRWKVGDAGSERRFTGATLLHVREASPREFDRHFGPITTCMLHGRSLAAISDATVGRLLDRLDAAEPTDRDQITAAVRALGAPSRKARRDATSELLRRGTSALPVLASIEPDDLGVEQTARIADIRRRLRRSGDDTPASLAWQLMNDREHWNRVATRLDDHEIARVSAYLIAGGFGPIEIDRTDDPRVASTP